MPGALDPELDRAPSAPVHATTVAAVAAGGALGGLARDSLAALVPAGTGVPWATLVVNMAGAFAVGVLATRIARGRTSARLRPFAVTGVCGGLTTFSTVMVELNLLVRDGRGGVALAYLAVTLVAGGAAAAVGARLAVAR